MLGRVIVENGVKKIVPLTADCGSGNPCGAIITVYQRTVPNGYLPLGAQYDITQFPVLYSILGTDTIPTASALGLTTLTTGQYVIKATSGINENQADNVLSALTPVNTVASGDMRAVTSNAVYGASPTLIGQMTEGASDVTDGTEFVSSYASDNGFADTNDGGPNKPYKRKFIKVWNYIQAKISSWMDSAPTSGSSNPITSGGVFSALGDKTKYYYTSIGSYSVNSNATISRDITNNCHTTPQGYKAIRLLFADGDNFFHTTVNYVSSTGKIYATITNNHTSGALSATFYVLELFIKD